jgi:hypothetical protein
LYFDGDKLNVQSSSILDNRAEHGLGGGIVFNGRELSVQSSEISNNFAYSSGGGLFAGATDGSIAIDGSTIDNNRSDRRPLAAYGDYSGGAYLFSSNSSVTIAGTTVSNNQALGSEANVGGMAIKAEDNSDVVIDRLTVTGNHADDDIGGLLIINSTSIVTVRNSTISGNTASHNALYEAGAGVWLQAFDGGSSTIEYSTISDNSIITPLGESSSNAVGAGLFIQNVEGTTTTIRNSTISGNQAEGSGGGIKIGDPPTSGGQVFILHSTITNNRADSDNDGIGTGGGIHIGDSTTTVTLDHTIVAKNFRGSGTTRDDIVGPVTASWSLIGDKTGTPLAEAPVGSPDANGNMIGGPVNGAIDPDLAPLAFNGGLTQTHSPNATSPVIDGGNPSAVNVPQFDQRGDPFDRVYNGDGVGGAVIDIGAHEVGLARVVDVRLRGVMPNGQPWEREPFSFAELVPLGQQLAPIYTDGVKTIEIQFSEAVTFPAMNPQETLNILGNRRQTISQSIDWGGYDGESRTATWNLSSPLGSGKYALQLLGVHDAVGLGVDGDWTNFDGPDEDTHTPDNFEDDKAQQLVSGNGSQGTIFEFFFSVMPGDYNQDGVVSNDGSNSDLLTLKDGDGDGDIDEDDEDIVDANDGTQLPLWKSWGDYNDDDIVDVDDYEVWANSYGATGDPPADGNGDGVVNAGDYLVWRSTVDDGWFSAWNTEPMMMATGVTLVDFGNAPKVANVTISGSASTHDPYAFAAVAGSGEQLRTVPVGGADTISITFSEDVNVVQSDLRLVGLRTANVPTVVEFAYDLATMTATWRLDPESYPNYNGWALGDHYLISLSDAVTDVEGNRLDGEWVNPVALSTTSAAVSEFPSGDGNAGGAFNFVFTLLPGDADRNLVVDDYDIDILAANYGLLTDALFTEGDFTGDGYVELPDEGLLFFNYGGGLASLWALADLNGDWAVDDDDLGLLADNIGLANPTQADGDLNGDGQVNYADLELAFAMYGLELDTAA